MQDALDIATKLLFRPPPLEYYIDRGIPIPKIPLKRDTGVTCEDGLDMAIMNMTRCLQRYDLEEAKRYLSIIKEDEEIFIKSCENAKKRMAPDYIKSSYENNTDLEALYISSVKTLERVRAKINWIERAYYKVAAML